MTKPIRVLLVDDSITVRSRLAAALEHDPGFELVAEAGDGARAVELCAAVRPDVVALDTVMPGMSGVEATREIMARCPTPILVVSAADSRGENIGALDALDAGAVEAFSKPRGGEEPDWDARFCTAMKLVAGIRVVTHGRRGAPRALDATDPDAADSSPALVAIGASLGGPPALARVLRGLPETFALPILVVVHDNPTFASFLVDWLDRQSRVRVTMALDGAPVPARGADPHVFLAPGDLHLVVRNGRMHLTSGPERHQCRPSVDVLFESVAREYGARALGCLLTGMGADGAAGLAAMRRAGAVTLAQDEASCAVFGMPGEAIALGGVSAVVPLCDIGARLGDLADGAELRRRMQ